MRLNEATIKKVEPPPKGNRIYRDGDTKGLGLRVTAAGAKAFVLNYSIEGRERRLTIGPWPEWSATAARERAKELRRMIDQGIDPLAEKEQRRAAPTVEDIIKAYLTGHAAKKKSGHVDRQYLERDVLPAWGKCKAADIGRRDVIALVERKAQTAPIAGNMLLSIIKGVWNWAIGKDLLEQNPAYRVKPPAKKKPRDRWLNEHGIRIVWDKLHTAKTAPECRTALRLILITGQRPGEVLGAEWSEVDLDGAWWVIPAEKAKNGIQHGVPLTALAIEQLQSLSRAGRWVIPGWWRDGRAHLTVAGLSNAVAVNREHFGIPRWTPHDLRRTAATHMAKAGVERFIIARVLNHSDKTITAIYERHSYDSEKRKALNAWERRLRGILEGRPSEKVISIG